MIPTKECFLYLQASILGTSANFFSRFFFSNYINFNSSVILANYIGMIIVFLLSYKRAFGVKKISFLMILKFLVIAHIGLLVVWVSSMCIYKLFNIIINTSKNDLLCVICDYLNINFRHVIEGLSHGIGIILGFIVNFIGHRYFTFYKNEEF